RRRGRSGGRGTRHGRCHHGRQGEARVRGQPPRGPPCREGGRGEEEKPTITAGSFDRQVSGKLGEYFDTTSLPAIKRLVEAGLSYEDVKRLVRIPPTWGAKISGEQFKRRAIRKGQG